MKNYIALIAIGTSCLSLAPVGFAAYPEESITPQLSTAQDEQSPWLVRTRALLIVPQASSSTIKPDLGGHADDISTQGTVEFDVNYFFTLHISTELILATARHTVEAKGTTLDDVDLGSVNLLPPTLTALYHFLPNSKIDPYVGAGVNYTYFYNVHSGTVATDINYQNSFGPALQAGFDVAINKNWSFNADVKKVYINSDVKVETGDMLPTQKTSVDINPLIFGVGFGYRFS